MSDRTGQPVPPAPPVAPPVGYLTPLTAFSWLPSAVAVCGHTTMPGAGWYAGAGVDAGRTMLLRPKGRRSCNVNSVDNYLFANPRDLIDGKYRSLWPDHGVEETLAGMRQYVGEMGSVAAPDLVVLDGEAGISYWALTDDDKRAISRDRRFPDLAERYGIPDPLGVRTIEDICRFNYQVCQYQAPVFDRAIGSVIRTAFPDALYSNFGDAGIRPQDATLVRDFNGVPQPIPPDGASVDSPLAYGYVNPGLTRVDPRFGTPFGALLWSYNTIAAAYLAGTTRAVPWLATRAGSNVWPAEWWYELVWHAMLLCGPNVLWFNQSADPAVADAELANALAVVRQWLGTRSIAACTTPRQLVSYDATALATCVRLDDGSHLGHVTYYGDTPKADVWFTPGKRTTIYRAKGVGKWFRI